jgi:phenylalanyl-tRNA synthetase beta chain
MRISLEWLAEFTPGGLDARAVADALTAGGLNVETVEGHGPQAVLDVEVTSNRGDCLCHIGVAREVAALLGRNFIDVQPAAREEGQPIAQAVQVRIESPQLCPHYTARLIRGVRVAPSPPKIAARLLAAGVRPISNVVDVTNYVLLEMGQPLHAFDFSRITGGTIVVRPARSGETLTTLDGHERKLDPSMLVIADASRPVALAGVMGGEGSQVTSATADVLLESAIFDPLIVRRTSRALALRSESSYRFERGIDPTLPARASLRAAQLILETAGGTLANGIASAGGEGYQPKVLNLRLSRLNDLLGMAIPAEQAVAALARLQLQPTLQGDRIEVRVPSWRLDLNIETDLIEEVARLIGYDRLPVRPQISIRVQPADPTAAAVARIRRTLVAAGFFEAVTFSFVSDALKEDFFPPAAEPLTADPAVRRADATLRPSILPGLLESVRHNETVGTPSAMLFEIGSVYLAGPDERRQLALVSGSDWRDLRGAVECLLERLDAEKPVRFVPGDRAGFARGACAAVDWNGKPIGFAGQIDTAIADKLSLRQSPMAAELDLQSLIAGAVSIPRQRKLPQFPAMRRDLSWVVDDDLPYEKLETFMRRESTPHLQNLKSVEFKTTFRGKPLEPGKKSVTVTLVFRSDEGTLTADQVDADLEKFIARAMADSDKGFTATLRR